MGKTKNIKLNKELLSY